MPRKLAYNQLSFLHVGKQQLGEDVHFLSGQVWWVWELGSDGITGWRPGDSWASFCSCPVLQRNQGIVDGVSQSVGIKALELGHSLSNGAYGGGRNRGWPVVEFSRILVRLCNSYTCMFVILLYSGQTVNNVCTQEIRIRVWMVLCTSLGSVMNHCLSFQK